MSRYRLTIAYLGTGFSGWQRQRTAVTIQGTLESCLGDLAHQSVTTMGASRTDAGVHAAGQVAHVDLPFEIPGHGLAAALNARLPEAVRILDARPAAATFHALADARWKRYVYRAHWDGDGHAPWRIQRSASVRPPDRPEVWPDLVMLLPGERDWRGFTVPDPQTRTTVRRLSHARISVTGRSMRLEVVGEGFLRFQVRRIVGALFQVGWGQKEPSWFARCLDHPFDHPPVLTAPARGLTLEHVGYRARQEASAAW